MPCRQGIISPAESARTYSRADGTALLGDPRSRDGMLNSKTAWAAARGKSEVGAYVVLDVGYPTLLSGVLTQGQYNRPYWVMAYEVSTSMDGVAWASVGVYQGNIDMRGTVERDFPAPVQARYVKLSVLARLGTTRLETTTHRHAALVYSCTVLSGRRDTRRANLWVAARRPRHPPPGHPAHASRRQSPSSAPPRAAERS